MSAPPPANTMQGVPQHILTLLDQLHAQSLEEERQFTKDDFAGGNFNIHDVMRDKFIALDQDKAQLVYTLCRAIDARTIVEAGTSFGVSTIYLALAAVANAASGGKPAKVVATEHEPTKAARAREHWRQCGEGVSGVVDLREGDLRETLKEDLEEVDFLLLDIWVEMALPTLKLVQPKMRRGAIVVADNPIMAAKGYQSFFEYTRSPESGFINLTMPYHNGLEILVYLPQN